MDSTTTDRFDTGRFEASRNRLASLAYRLLGSAADAEDAVQDAFLHWQAADRERIKVPEAWLTKIITNLCLDRLRSAQARRERAVGVWLPEPLLDGDPMLGPADTFEQRESVSLAVLTLMERLSPIERAVYVLREAFSYSHAEIAEILDITESASQQHLHRARRRITAARRGGGGGEVDPASARRIVEEFLAAASSGRTEVLLRQVPVGREVAVLPCLTGGEGEVQLAGRGPDGRGGTGTARPGHVVAHPEAVVVLTVRMQAVDLGVHGVCEFGRGDHAAPLHGAAEAFVRGHLVLHPDRAARHAAQPVGGERIGGEAGPQHDTIGPGVSRGHAQREGVAAQRRGGERQIRPARAPSPAPERPLRRRRSRADASGTEIARSREPPVLASSGVASTVVVGGVRQGSRVRTRMGHLSNSE